MTTRLRVLVGIPHHGSKNRGHLERMLDAFRSMRHDVSVVVFSESEKSLPDDVEVRVGLPLPDDPWSLPFAHRELFAQRQADYDLFVYAEDDTLIEERHLDAVVELGSLLPDDLLVGFQRYEVDAAGRRSYCSVHSHYRWDPSSLVRHGGLTFAHFTNDHAAAYVLTRRQLARAIASGGYLVPPHADQYDMLVSAGVDVYTRCGFTKVLCLERIDDLLVHHLPNVYLGRMGVDENSFRAQISQMLRIARVGRPAETSFVPETRMSTRRWDRACFPLPNPSLQELLPEGTRRVLSLGTASGDVEAVLVALGMEVVGIPVDEVLGAAAASRGIQVLDPALPSEKELEELGPFDVLLAVDVLHYLDDPPDVLRRLGAALAEGGVAVVSCPAHDRYRLRNLARPPHRRDELPRSFTQDGIAPTDARWVRDVLRSAGFASPRVTWRQADRRDPLGRGGPLARLSGNTVVQVASRSDAAMRRDRRITVQPQGADT